MTATIPANPPLSPSFTRAGKISRFLAILLAATFWVITAALVFLGCTALWALRVQDTAAFPSDLRFAQIICTIPIVVALHHGKRVFSHFARGEVFSLAAISAIRASALWLMVAGLTTITPMPLITAVGLLSNYGGGPPDSSSVTFGDFSLLVFGACAYVAAYVMAETLRIADDNASIV